MSKKVNRFFNTAIRRDIERVSDELMISEEQAQIFRFRYIQHKDIGYIADTMGYSPSKIKQELARLRQMLDKIL